MSNKVCPNNCLGDCRECKLDEKKLKAFEILKPYLKDIIGCNQYDKDFAEFFIETRKGRKFISKGKYDLLKEAIE